MIKRSIFHRTTAISETSTLERIVKLRKTYLNMCYTLEQCCERLHRENSKLLMRVKLIQRRREMEAREYDCSSIDIHTTQYTSWIKCVQCIPNPENGTQLKWTVPRLIDTINRMFYRESFEDCMKIAVEKMGNEYESTMENLGRTIMDRIRKQYEKRQGYKISYLEQEKYFAIFPHDPLFIEILYYILKELATELHKQEEYREELVESHADSLASDDTVALSDSKDTFFEKERVERRWNKMVIYHDNQKAELRKRIKQKAVLMYQIKLKRKVFDSFRQSKKRKVQAEAAKSLRAKVHYMKVVMRKVLRRWHEIADLRSRCRRAVRILRRVQKKSLERRAFIALESLRKNSGRNQSTEVERPRSAPSHRRRKTPEKKEINKGREERSVHHQAKDGRKPEKQRARSTGRRGNFLMISATKLKDEATPDMIKQLKENIKKQRAWLKHLEQYENKVTSKK